MRSRWEGSMLACTLNTNPENGASSGRGTPSTSARGAGDGTRSTTASSSLRTPKLVRAEPKKTGVASPARNALRSSSAPAPSSSVELVERRRPTPRPPRRRPDRASTTSSGASVAPRATRVKRVNRPSRRSTTPRKSPAMPTGQVTGRRHRGRSVGSISSSSSTGSRPGPVPLVDEGEQRQAALAAHLEQLQRLGLDALGRVEHHDRGVGRGQHAVGVLGEVAVAGGVEQVDARGRGRGTGARSR